MNQRRPANGTARHRLGQRSDVAPGARRRELHKARTFEWFPRQMSPRPAKMPKGSDKGVDRVTA